MKTAIIDLGTNTFNILIAELSNNKFKPILNTKSAVMLGNEGLDNGYLSEKAFKRAYEVLYDFKQLVNDFSCENIIAYGTSAIRSAQNSGEFIDKVKNKLGICIEPISGDKESDYIYHGVKQAVEFSDENYLILDIGGGSNEFIIANKDKMLWKHSFALGGARLLNMFNPEDLISEKTIKEINEYLFSELTTLRDILKQTPVTKLIGSSGAFDNFAEMSHYNKTSHPLSKKELSYKMSINEFDTIYNTLIKTTRADRLLIPGLEDIRVDTIVMAAIFTKYVIELSEVDEIIRSAYSLKEGVIALNCQCLN